MPLDFHRVSKCHYVRIKDYVSIKSAQVTGSTAGSGISAKSKNRAYYEGVAACGSVWVCPICSAKIQQQRREECSVIFDKAKSESLQVVLVTLTFPHYPGDSLGDLLKAQQVALKYLKQGNPYKKFRDRFGVFGFIQNREITHGRNGWHPHNHIGYICDILSEDQQHEFTQFIKDRWVNSLVRAGFVFNHGGESRACDVLPNANLDQYLAKADGDFSTWGAADELSRSNSKKAKGTARTPFQIVKDYQKTHRRTDAQLFIEYLTATKGKAQMFFSRGLKDWAGLNDESDQDIVEKEQPDPVVLALDRFDWDIVRGKRFQAGLLSLVETQGKNAGEEWLLDNGGYYNILVHDSGGKSAISIFDDPPD